jgi:hypothetical protein
MTEMILKFVVPAPKIPKYAYVDVVDSDVVVVRCPSSHVFGTDHHAARRAKALDRLRAVAQAAVNGGSKDDYDVALVMMDLYVALLDAGAAGSDWAYVRLEASEEAIGNAATRLSEAAYWPGSANPDLFVAARDVTCRVTRFANAALDTLEWLGDQANADSLDVGTVPLSDVTAVSGRISSLDTRARAFQADLSRYIGPE